MSKYVIGLAPHHKFNNKTDGVIFFGENSLTSNIENATVLDDENSILGVFAGLVSALGVYRIMPDGSVEKMEYDI